MAGANRGIGLNLVKAYTAKSWHVTGTIRPQSRDDVSVKDVIATALSCTPQIVADKNKLTNAISLYLHLQKKPLKTTSKSR